MRKKIAQRAGKALLQSSVYSLLVGALSIPASGWAAGWTQEFGKVLGTQSYSAGFFIWLDPAVASNVNNCTAYINSNVSGWLGQDAAGFFISYPTSGAPTEAQKVIISQILLAVATGKRVKIHSVSCSSNYNSVDYILLNAN